MENMGKGRFLPKNPGPSLPINDAARVLHQKAKEENSKARAAWEEGGRKSYGVKKADMDNKRDLLVTITTCQTMVKGKRQSYAPQSLSAKITVPGPAAIEATPVVPLLHLLRQFNQQEKMKKLQLQELKVI